MFEFLEDETSEGRLILNQVLRTKAIQIIGGLKTEGFKASCGWLSQWNQRYNVGMNVGTHNAQSVPSGYADLLHTFQKSIIVIQKAEKIGPEDITNMDQTMCRFDLPPSRTNKRGEQTIRINTTRAEKKGFTVALTGTATRRKLPAVIVFKKQGRSLVEHIRLSLCIPSNAVVRATTTLP